MFNRYLAPANWAFSLFLFLSFLIFSSTYSLAQVGCQLLSQSFSTVSAVGHGVLASFSASSAPYHYTIRQAGVDGRLGTNDDHVALVDLGTVLPNVRNPFYNNIAYVADVVDSKTLLISSDEQVHLLRAGADSLFGTADDQGVLLIDVSGIGSVSDDSVRVSSDGIVTILYSEATSANRADSRVAYCDARKPSGQGSCNPRKLHTVNLAAVPWVATNSIFMTRVFGFRSGTQYGAYIQFHEQSQFSPLTGAYTQYPEYFTINGSSPIQTELANFVGSSQTNGGFLHRSVDGLSFLASEDPFGLLSPGKIVSLTTGQTLNQVSLGANELTLGLSRVSKFANFLDLLATPIVNTQSGAQHISVTYSSAEVARLDLPAGAQMAVASPYSQGPYSGRSVMGGEYSLLTSSTSGGVLFGVYRDTSSSSYRAFYCG